MIIAVDSGKYATKGKSKNKEVIFRTKITQLQNNIDVLLDINSYKVFFNKQKYIVGEQGEAVDYVISKKTFNHKLAIYTAIALLLEETKETQKVELVLGCPTSIYRNEELREEYKKYILNKSEIINIRVNNKEYTFYIDNILMLPEASGIIYTDVENFKEKRVAVIDIGGLNLNFTIYNNLIPEINTMFTANLGGNKVKTEITKELNSKYNLILNDRDLQQILKDKVVKIQGKEDKESTILINDILKQYTNNILQEIKKNNINLELMNVTAIGGGTLLIKDILKQHIQQIKIPTNAQMANVRGFFKLGVLKYAEK